MQVQGLSLIWDTLTFTSKSLFATCEEGVFRIYHGAIQNYSFGKVSTEAREIFNPVENPLLLLAAAYAIRRLPYVVRSVSSGLEQTPEEMENAAHLLVPLKVDMKIGRSWYDTK